MSTVSGAARIAVLSSLPFAVLAQAPLDEAVITATRTQVPVDELTVPYFAIDRDTIERSLASDVGELLRTHAGIELARAGGPGQPVSLFTRGTDSNHTVVLIDGVRVNPGTIGSPALQNIAPETVQRIEVVKGPRSTLYGSDAIGGVVNVITHAGAARGLAAYASGARYGSHAAGLGGGWRLGEAGGVGFAVDWRESAGFPTRTGATQDRGYDKLTINLAGDYAPSETVSLRARAWRAAGNTEYSTTVFDPVTYAPRLAPVDQDFGNASYALETVWKPRAQIDVRVALTRIEDRIDQNQDGNGLAAPPHDFLRTDRDGLEVQTNLRLHSSDELTLGAFLTREDTASLSYGTHYAARTRVDQFFAQNRFSHGPHSLVTALGLVDHEAFGHEPTWNAEYGITFPSATRVTLGAGRAFRAPDSTDLYGYGGNPRLAPEVSRQVEAGVRQPLGAHHSVYANAWRNDIDDLVEFVFDPVTYNGHNENVGRARIEGVELGYAYAGTTWRTRLEASLQNPRNRDTDERLLRRARENYVLAVERTAGRLALGADITRATSRYDVAFPANVRLGGYTLVNVMARYAVTPRWSVQARIDNAFDEAYTLVSGYNTMRRSVLVATRLALQ
ncbi:MAG: TonB-dependent receptor [Gammaproteobacteria bacterium]|nr:TonB-dependent receptor [Gammaproteobacteria bacterium]